MTKEYFAGHFCSITRNSREKTVVRITSSDKTSNDKT